MGCLAIFLNLLLPGLGTLLFTSKRIQGFIQLFLTVVNGLLVLVTFGIWGTIGGIIHLALFAWALAATITDMSERAAKKAAQEEREN
jgi:hypothetical protein